LKRLVVVSNRCNVPRGGSVPGGLAVALTAALRECGGLWFGWDGKVAEDSGRKPAMAQVDRVDYATLPLARDAYEGYYKGYANRVLWPLCHYRVDSIQYRHWFEDRYWRTNELFARKLLPLLGTDDRIWVHDYHLIPLGSALREADVRQPLGFFLHIPFPAPDVLRALPQWHRLLWDLCAYDLVGFQTRDDAQNFLEALRRLTRAKVGRDGAVDWDGRRSRAAAFPISIDVEEVCRMVDDGRDIRTVRGLERSLQGRALIVGVDRLDYSKGLPERFQSYAHLLANYPQVHGRVVFLQVAQPSRADVPEYEHLKARLEAIVGHINGEFAEFDWAPIRYINKSYARATIMNFLAMARVGLVTPLRDGMNLVAKEFIAAQTSEDPGVLILSEFAGAARELDSALLVNPYDQESVADALGRAMDMPIEERRERWQHALDRIRGNDIFQWSRSFLEALERCRSS
jgi:trehalose 6-phosphate synthase